MFIRTPYNYDADIVSHKSGVDFSDSPSLAQQHMRDETDINVMVERFARTGMPEMPPAFEVDVSDSFDFQTAMGQIRAAQEQFNALPSRLRERFRNDPGQFLAFVGDESNRHEAIALGLIPQPTPEPEVAPAPSKPPVTPPAE